MLGLRGVFTVLVPVTVTDPMGRVKTASASYLGRVGLEPYGETQDTLECRRTAEQVGSQLESHQRVWFAPVREAHFRFAEDRHVVSVAYRLKLRPAASGLVWCAVVSAAAVLIGSMLSARSGPYLWVALLVVVAWPLIGAALRQALVFGIRNTAVSGDSMQAF